MSARETVTPATGKNTSSRAATRQSREQSRARIVAAAIELLRERSYPDLSVGEVMERAGSERTIFYRHFDDLGDLLLRAGRESIEALYTTEIDLGATRDGSGTRPGAIRDAIRPVVAFYEHHGALLRALEEAAVSDERIAGIETYAKSYTRLSPALANELAMKALDVEARRIALKRTYYTKLAAAVSPLTAAKALQMENQIQLIVDLQIAASLPVLK